MSSKKNITINLAGLTLPLIAALYTFPPLLHGLGKERFGILILAWTVIGYFNIFDLGIGKALTKLIAENEVSKRHDRNSIILTGLSLMLILGLIACIILILTNEALVENLLKIPDKISTEAQETFFILGLSIPFIIITAGIIGILEAFERFDLINLIRVPTGVLTFALPLIVLSFSNSLPNITYSLLAVRVIALGLYLFFLMKIINATSAPKFNKKIMNEIFSFGGWITVSNIIGPIMLYSDKFLITSFVSISATANYSIPFEIIIKLLLIPSAIISVFFPKFSQAVDNKNISNLYKNAIQYNLLILILPSVILFYFSQDILTYWLKSNLPGESIIVAKILIIGVIFNSFGLISQSLIQAYGRPDLTAKTHLIEIPMYLIYSIILINNYGIIGAAIAWCLRVFISAVILYALTLIVRKNPNTTFFGRSKHVEKTSS